MYVPNQVQFKVVSTTCLLLHMVANLYPLSSSSNWTPPPYFTLQLDPSPLFHPSIGLLPLISPFSWTPPPYFTLQLDPSPLFHPSIGPLPLISPFNWTPPPYFTLQLDPSPLFHPSIGPLRLISPFKWTPPPAGLQELSVWEDCRSPSNPHLVHLPRVHHCCWIEVLLSCVDLPVLLSRRCVHAYVRDVAHEEWKYTYIQTYVHTYAHTYIRTYYIHFTYTCTTGRDV